MATIYDGYDPSATTWNNAYRLRLLVENTPNAALNQSVVRIRMILYANGSQWFDGWTITENVDYATWNAANVKSAVVAVQNSPSGNQTQGSAGADKTWVDKSYTIAHDLNGNLRMSVHGDFKTNTAPSPTYPYLVPALSEGVAVSTATAPNTTTQQIVPYFTTGFSGAPTVTRSSGGATMTIAVPNAVVTNTSVNNTVTYTYQYSFDGTTWYGNTNTAPIGASAWTVNAGTAPFTSAAASYTVYVRCVTNSNGLTTPNISATSVGVPSLPTTISAAEDTNQSRQVRISWTPGSDNGSALTNQTLVWSPNSDLSGATSTTITPGTNYYDIASNRSTGALLPNKTYYYKLTMSNAVGDNGTSVYSFTTRSSTPKISTTVNGLPTTRSTLKVMTAGGMVSAQARVFDGTTWQYLK